MFNKPRTAKILNHNKFVAVILFFCYETRSCRRWTNEQLKTLTSNKTAIFHKSRDKLCQKQHYNKAINPPIL